MVNIDATSIGIKDPVKVKESIKNVKKSFKFEQTMVKILDIKDKDDFARAIKYYGNQIKGIDYELNYITDMLRLNAKQIKHLQSVEFSKIQNLATEIVTKVLHMNKDDNTKVKKGKK